MTQAYILPAAAREELLRYLGNKPYREVAMGMQALLDLKPLEDGLATVDLRGEEPASDG